MSSKWLSRLGLVGLLALAAGGALLVDHAFHRHGPPAAEHELEGEHKGEHEGEHEDGKVHLSAAQRQNAELELLTAGPGKVSVTVELPGEIALNADAVAHVTPRVGGTVREVKKQIGDAVKKGDVLAILDSRELAELQRDVLTAKERLTLAEGNFERQEQLQKEKISAEKDFLAAKQALAEARIEHRSAAQKLAAAAGATGSQAGGYALVAPIAGTILERHVVAGEVLKDETLAFVIANLSTVWVNVTVYAKDLARVAVGQPARVRAEGIEEAVDGHIAYLGPIVGEQTRSATARIVLDRPPAAWRPGLFVTAEVVLSETEGAVVVSDDAVQTIAGKPVVFVREGDAFDPRPVKLGRTGSRGREGYLVEIVSGVAAGEQVVGKNSFVLKAVLGKAEAGHEH